MKKLVCSLIIAGLCFFSISVIPILAGGLSQDPQALSFLGSYEGTILAKAHQRSLDLTLSAIDDNGNVKVGRFHQGAVGRFAAEDVAGVTGLFQRENGEPQIILEAPGRFKMILTKEAGGGLLAKIIGGPQGMLGTIRLEKK